MRLRRGLSALAVMVTVIGGMTAATGTPEEDTEAGTSPAALQNEREKTLNGPRPAPKYPHVKEQQSCEKVRREARASGKKQAVCVELVDAAAARKRLTSAPSATAGGIVWCDDKEMGIPYVTRVSVCESQLIQATLINTQTGVPLGVAFLTVKQEINTREVDGKPLPIPGSFHEDFYMQVQAASGALAGGFTVEIDAECVPTSQCQQGEDPWTGAVPVTILSELEGTWNRVWTEPVTNATMALGYTITVKQGGHKGSHSWGVNESNAWQVRCDKEIGATIGCIVPAFVPTLVVDYLKYPAGSDYIADAMAYIPSHPGRRNSDGSGNPLRREANDATATANRNRVCDRTFAIEDEFDGKFPLQCDEYPFARTKESGGGPPWVGIRSGKDCKQFRVVPGYADREPRRNHSMFSFRPHGTGSCARATMLKVDNEGIGGDLGRFYTSQRVLNNDPFWVDAITWAEYCGCLE